MDRFRRTILACLFAAAAAASALAATTRLALVIGNTDYEGDAALRSPVNDAADMAAALREIGWNVQMEQNVDQLGFVKAVIEFRNSLAASADATALFFYAGHAMQIEGRNFLLPVKTAFPSLDEVEWYAINLNTVTQAIQQGGVLISFIILDSCRDNPFTENTSRSSARVRGLAPMHEGGGARGSAIAFSTSPGDIASDGGGPNSIFTEAILKYIKSSLKIEELFKAVNAEVRQATKEAQKPWINASLSSDVYFISDELRFAKAAETERAAEAARQAEPKGKARIESSFKGQVYVGDELLGEIEPDFPLAADRLATGERVFRFVSPGRPDETKSATVGDKAYVTVIFGRGPVVSDPDAGNETGSSAYLELYKKTYSTIKSMNTSDLRKADPFALNITSLAIKERFDLFDNLEKKGALGYAALNIVPFLGLGSFAQGNIGYGLYQVGSIVVPLIWILAKASAASNSLGFFSINLAFSYIGGFFAPLIYQDSYNHQLRRVLLLKP